MVEGFFQRTVWKKLYIGALVLFLLTFAPSAHAADSIQSLEGAPAGFETLETPRATLVTVYYGGELVGQFPAHFTPTTVQFDDPESLIKQVPSVADGATILKRLGRRYRQTQD